MASAAIDNLILKRNGISLSKGKLAYLQKKSKEYALESVMCDEFGKESAITKPTTAADRLLAQFDADSETSYVVLYAEYDSDRLTIKKKCKHCSNHKIYPVDANELTDASDSAVVTAEKMRKSIRDSLSVTAQNGMILLAAAWTDDKSRSRFDLYPDLVVTDTTQSINREERPLMLFTALDSRNKTFTFTWVFLPADST
jgi:hypothetical protein